MYKYINSYQGTHFLKKMYKAFLQGRISEMCLDISNKYDETSEGEYSDEFLEEKEREGSLFLQSLFLGISPKESRNEESNTFLDVLETSDKLF